MTLVSTQKVGYEGGLARDRERLAKLTRLGACDGDGFVTKPKMPTGLAADVFVCDGKECDEKTSNRKKLVSTAVLLAGGAVIGYCLKGPIGNCVKGLSDKFTKFFSEGKPAEYLQKAKDLVMSKK